MRQMTTNYDADILQGYADDLYQQARYIIIATVIKYGLITFLVSAVLSSLLFSYISHVNRTNEGNAVILCVIIFTTLGIAAGISEGRRKAFQLKLEAQQLLCQRQIEINTHAMLQNQVRPTVST
jgi:hypothetical protein